MSDIVEKLNAVLLRLSSKKDYGTVSEAAEEITSLREENARLREALKPFADNRSFVFNGPEMREALRAAAAAIREGGNE